MRLDSARFPSAAAFIETLPSGFASYPACALRADVCEPFQRDFSRLLDERGLPTPVTELLSKSGRSGRWVSEVAFQAMNLVVRDVGFPSDAAFFEWTQNINQEIFDKPFLRGLMRLLSPTLIVAGASKRWAAFHKGSTLTSDPVSEAGGRSRTSAHLTYPDGLFPKLFLEGLERAFFAAVSGSRAKDVEVVLVRATGTSAEYRVSYRARD